jgi:hypothetical protein
MRHNLLRWFLLVLSIVVALAIVLGCGVPGDNTVVVKVSPAVMKEISSWDNRWVCFTSAKNPIHSLNGLTYEQIATSSDEELSDIYRRLFIAVGEPKELHIVFNPTVADIFIKNPELRLYIAAEVWEKYITQNGGVKIRFETK